MKHFSNKWEKIPVPTVLQTGESWSKDISHIWRKLGKEFSFALQIRNFSIMFNRNPYNMAHIIIKKSSSKGSVSGGLPRSNALTMFMQLATEFEPDYAEKSEIIKVAGFSNRSTLEVFPSTTKLVDDANLFHLWVLPESFQMPTIPVEIRTSIEFGNFRYGISSFSCIFGDIVVAKIENNPKLPIPWAKKQEFKNQIFGKSSTAIEFIPANPNNIEHIYMFCLSEYFQLPFCLKN